MARIGGLHSLPIVARLADREKASLGLSLPPLLTSLVKHGRLGADFAVGLVGLDSPAETWSWRLLDFANAVIPRLAPALRSEAMHHLLTEIDRRYQLSPPRDTLQGLADVCRAYLASGIRPASSRRGADRSKGHRGGAFKDDPELGTPVPKRTLGKNEVHRSIRSTLGQ